MFDLQKKVDGIKLIVFEHYQHPESNHRFNKVGDPALENGLIAFFKAMSENLKVFGWLSSEVIARMIGSAHLKSAKWVTSLFQQVPGLYSSHS